jgi:uncharacterized protein
MTTGGCAQRALRTRPLLALLIGACIACSAGAATPDEDYAAGLKSFRSGDVTGAMTPLRRAADGGHAPSQFLLGFIFDNAGLTPEAVPLFRRAAAQGHADAQVALAGLLMEGRAVARDPRAAFRLYASAAQQGQPAAIQAVADAYLRNDAAMLGDDATDALALAALRRAGEAGDLRSAERLATVYQQGLYGAPADVAEAARWQARAASQRPRAAGAKK